MKKANFRWLISILCMFTLFISTAFSQEKEKKKEEEETPQFQEEITPGKDQQETVPERLKFYKERYEETFSESFDMVWRAIKKSLDDIGCMISYEKYQQNDEGYFTGTLKSDFCVFSFGKDTTFQVLKRYSYEMPLIRGGIWINGRIQYTFKVKENPDGSVFISFKGQLSGFEDFVTHQVHFWKSNGILETQMLERIKNNLKLVKE
ncbi:hypothetical protein D9V87_02810 [Bacteroidetes/Chlorobi group bacterium MS-B_bin-24]|nr:MAG: hypothetical protein D9V87_02810 [Bacteroidetes/Chlorobi group bacterium MS-B_bin-24]